MLSYCSILLKTDLILENFNYGYSFSPIVQNAILISGVANPQVLKNVPSINFYERGLRRQDKVALDCSTIETQVRNFSPLNYPADHD